MWTLVVFYQCSQPFTKQEQTIIFSANHKIFLCLMIYICFKIHNNVCIILEVSVKHRQVFLKCSPDSTMASS